MRGNYKLFTKCHYNYDITEVITRFVCMCCFVCVVLCVCVVFRRVRKNAKSDYQLRHVCPSVCPNPSVHLSVYS